MTLKELKEIVMKKSFMGKSWNWCEKNGNINKEIENLKRNQKGILELKKYNNWNEKFTRWIQRQVWTGTRKNQWTQKWGEVKITQSCPDLCDPMDYAVHEIL